MELNAKMRKLIHKAFIPIDSFRTPVRLRLPDSFEVLSTSSQNGQVCFWYEFNEAGRGVLKEIEVLLVFTGQTFQDDGTLVYMGTVQHVDGLVYHLYFRKLN
jgi:hypothetical protein